MISEADIAWCAGFFEGEGTLCYTNKHLEFKITQVDIEPLEKFAKIMGDGVKILGPYKNGKASHIKYIYSMNGYISKDIKIMYEQMKPWLSQRRIDQAEKAFTEYYEYKSKLKFPHMGKLREKEWAKRKALKNE